MDVNDKPQNNRQAGHIHAWWRSPLAGYPVAILAAFGAFLIPWSERSLGIQDNFIVSPFVMATILIGWIWGIGPALLALILEVLALDYWIIPPLGGISFFRWPEIASFGPFILLQLIVLGLTVTQKNVRLRLLQNTEQLAENNIQLEQAHRVKDLFFSMASHELKTPVTSIRGHVQLLQRRLKEQSAQNPELLSAYAELSKVDEQTQRLTDLVNDLLDLNSLRSGKMPVRLAPCDLCALCREVVEEQRVLTDRQIDLTLSSCPFVLQVDEKRLYQVLSNLVTNAFKYSPAHTPIRVEVSQRREEAMLAVHNEGSGLSKEQQKAIFEPFYRSPQAQGSAKPGWGLGLAICKEIVAQHNGRLWVESTEEKGTTFFVALPLNASTPAFTQQRVRPEKEQDQSAKNSARPH